MKQDRVDKGAMAEDSEMQHGGTEQQPDDDETRE